MITIKPSDLQYRYPRDVGRRFAPKFSGPPDAHPFNRDDLYEILPMMAVVMDAIGSTEGRVLHLVEEILNRETPRFIVTREETFDYLVGMARERLGLERS